MRDLLTLIDGALYNSTGYFLVALGVIISIRFAGFPDLTVDGSFTFGAAIYAVAIKKGFPVGGCMLLSWVAGAAAGAATATLNRSLRIGRIISSVIVMLLLITVVPYITGGATVGLLDGHHFIALLQRKDIELTRQLLPGSALSLHLLFILLIGSVGLAAAVVVWWFFQTRLGVQLRYMGSAISPSLLSSRQQAAMIYLGLMAGNSLVGLGGAIEAERNGGFSQFMGTGVILIGLATVVLGESIIKAIVRRDHLRVAEYVLAATLGVFIYSAGLRLLLLGGLTSVDVRLTTTALLLVLLAAASRRHPNTGRLF